MKKLDRHMLHIEVLHLKQQGLNSLQVAEVLGLSLRVTNRYYISTPVQLTPRRPRYDKPKQRQLV